MTLIKGLCHPHPLAWMAVSPRRSLLALLISWAGLTGLAQAQGPFGNEPRGPVQLGPLPSPLGEEGAPPIFPLGPQPIRGAGLGADLPQIAPQPPMPNRDVHSFLESLRGNDAAFDVVVGQGRVLTTKEDLTAGQNQPLVAVGDPTVIDFTVLNGRQIRITGQRIGATDLSITTADGRTFTFEVRVVADLSLLTGKLKAIFPDASLRLGQLRDHVVVEGEARDTAQVARIIETISAYLTSVQMGQSSRVQGQQGGPRLIGPAAEVGAGVAPVVPGVSPDAAAESGGVAPVIAPLFGAVSPAIPALASPELNPLAQVAGTVAPPRIINLIRIPGSQQVLLKVRVAELNRTALRQIGANFLGIDPSTGAIVGSQIAGTDTALGRIGTVTATSTAAAVAPRSLIGGAALPTNGTQTTVFGIFQDANFEFTLNALRRNSFLKILAEPNLVALSGFPAGFLAGGEFPVPVPQVSAAGVAPTITVRFREFGVRLNFVPYVLDDEVIRLSVAPEVSQIDFAISTTLVAGGTPVPGLNTRKAQTTVELRQGQTLAIAGLLQLSLDGTLNRIPGLGDLPILGPFFSNTTGQRVEKELVVLVTPYLIEPMNPGQVPPGPGDEVKEPNDLEFYFLDRIEGRTGVDFRSTTAWDDPLHLVPLLNLEKKYVHGPAGFSE